MPIAQTSWKPWRRSRHWSRSAAANARAKSDVSVGRSAVGTGSGLGSAGVDDDVGERDADLAEDLDRDEEPGEQEQHAEQLADEETARRSEAVRATRDRRDQPAERDEDRRRDAAVEPAADEGPNRTGHGRDEVHDDRERGDEEVCQEPAKRLPAIQRVADEPALRHEDVGRIERPESECEG